MSNTAWYIPVNSGEWNEKMEYLIQDESKTTEQVIAGLPTDCAPGSVAYKASMSVMVMFNGTTWIDMLGSNA